MVVDLRFMRPYWKPMGVAGLILLFPNTAYAAYEKGTITRKAQPIIDLMLEGVEPIAYGSTIWSLVSYMMGHKAEAKDRFKGVMYAVVGIKLLPWLFDILNSVGVE